MCPATSSNFYFILCNLVIASIRFLISYFVFLRIMCFHGATCHFRDVKFSQSRENAAKCYNTSYNCTVQFLRKKLHIFEELWKPKNMHYLRRTLVSYFTSLLSRVLVFYYFTLCTFISTRRHVSFS